MRGDRVAIGGLHLGRHAAPAFAIIVGLFGDGLAQVEAFGDQRLEARAGVHARRAVPPGDRRTARLPVPLSETFGTDDVAGHHHRQAVGERDRRRRAVERRGQPIEKPRSVGVRRAARRRDRHAALDAVLRFEVAAREILGAGERHERELALLPERQHRVLERRMQAPRRPRRPAAPARSPHCGLAGSGFGSAIVGRDS